MLIFKYLYTLLNWKIRAGEIFNRNGVVTLQCVDFRLKYTDRQVEHNNRF